MIINTAIVEDDDGDAESLASMLKKYSESGKAEFRVSRFRDAISFLEGYVSSDLVFMDIELPDYDGMKASKKLREKDKSVMIIFVTNMAQFAVSGYEVNAFDFVVKPVTYGNLSLKLDRALPHFVKEAQRVSIYSPDGTRIVPVSEIKYVEVMNHRIVWHTTEGDLSLCGSLKKAEEQLPPSDFCRINNCYIVNLKYVTSVGAQTIVCAGDELSVSRPRRREFMRAMTEYIEGGRR